MSTEVVPALTQRGAASTVTETARRPAAGSGVKQAKPSVVHAQQSDALPRMVHGKAIRQRVDGFLDLVRLKLDSFPHGVYQPVDLPVGSAKRATGSRTRWAEIGPVVERLAVETATDLGANCGYFSIELGKLGVTTVAVESDARHLRTAGLAIRRSGQENVALLSSMLTPQSVELLPAVDATVFLSLWHHLVRHQGLDDATHMTQRIWSRTSKVMFFDSGENEMDETFGLPEFGPDARSWFAGYLTRVCAQSRVEQLGRHDAFDAAGLPCQRNLFAVFREPERG